MLFPSDSIVEARHALLQQVEDGTLTREQAFLQALALDPFDAVALIVLAEERYAAGDLARTAEYSWRAALADPCRCEPWFKLTACYPDEDQAFRDGLMELGVSKALCDPEGLAQFEEYMKRSSSADDFPDGEAFLAAMADQFREKQCDEPEEVSRRLRPHRLIEDLLEEAVEGLDEETVDRILADGASLVPLLTGVLRAMATGSLGPDESASVVCSLALLGEIGDPAALPELIECHSVDEDVIPLRPVGR